MIERNEDGLFQTPIDDKQYQFEKWGAEESFTTLVKLSHMIGKPLGMLLGAMAGGAETSLLDRQVNPDMIAMAFESLTSNLDEHKALSLFKKLTSEKR